MRPAHYLEVIASKMQPKASNDPALSGDGLVLHLILKAAIQEIDRKGVVRQAPAVADSGRVALAAGEVVGAEEYVVGQPIIRG